MKRNRIEAIVANVIDVIALHAPTSEELQYSLALILNDLAPNRTGRLRIYEAADRVLSRPATDGAVLK